MSNLLGEYFATRPEKRLIRGCHVDALDCDGRGYERSRSWGNAFDAGVAAAFALQVVERHLNGPGGDVPILIYAAKTGRTEVLCGQGTAPARATIEAFRQMVLDLIPDAGLHAACLPGTFDAYMLLLRDYGTMSVEDVLAPAIGYARNGYPLVQRIFETIATVQRTIC